MLPSLICARQPASSFTQCTTACLTSCAAADVLLTAANGDGACGQQSSQPCCGQLHKVALHSCSCPQQGQLKTTVTPAADTDRGGGAADSRARWCSGRRPGVTTRYAAAAIGRAQQRLTQKIDVPGGSNSCDWVSARVLIQSQLQAGLCNSFRQPLFAELP